MDTRSLINSLADDAIAEQEASEHNEFAVTHPAHLTHKESDGLLNEGESSPVEQFELGLESDAFLNVSDKASSENHPSHLTHKQSDDLLNSGGTLDKQRDDLLNSADTPEGYLSLFRAAYLRHDLALAEDIGIAARIQKGVAYCEANPKNKEAAKLLSDLRSEQTRLRQSIEWEAVQLYELEKEILKGTPAKFVCGTCYTPLVGACETCWPREATYA